MKSVLGLLTRGEVLGSSVGRAVPLPLLSACLACNGLDFV